MSEANDIAVVGSINMDLVTEVSSFPSPGETVVAKRFTQFPGGKGANQAVGVGRLGGEVSMYGMVGDDLFSSQLIKSLKDNGVNTDQVIAQKGFSSGIATILVDDQGENMIAINQGANGEVDSLYIEKVLPKIEEAKVLLLQFEIPLETIGYLLNNLSTDRPLVILDPAPAKDIRSLPMERVDILTPNLVELEVLSNKTISDDESLKKAGRSLISQKQVKSIICKAGESGSYLITKSKFVQYPPHRVEIIDTTAAGDAFNAGLAFSLAQDKSRPEAINYANAAGALSATKRGAQTSMPTREEVQDILR